jgi:hypothetical protein
MSETIVESIRGCARCHGDGHENLEFKELAYPVEISNYPPITHWAMCPTSGEPIMMRFEPKVFACRR